MGSPINLLLESLPIEVKSALMKRLEHVELPLRTSLFNAEETPRHIHFMTAGVASSVTTMEGGEAVEVGLTGHEGFAEKIHVLGPQAGSVECFMQIEGSAFRMNFRQFQAEFMQNPALLRAVLRYAQHDAFVLAQLGACNRLHEVEARLARWLLMVQDRVGGSDIRLTQEFLGEMLGAKRSSVNLAAGSLQRSGIITHNWGRIHIESRELLEGVACECYPIISKLFQRALQVRGSWSASTVAMDWKSAAGPANESTLAATRPDDGDLGVETVRTCMECHFVCAMSIASSNSAFESVWQRTRTSKALLAGSAFIASRLPIGTTVYRVDSTRARSSSSSGLLLRQRRRGCALMNSTSGSIGSKHRIAQ